MLRKMFGCSHISLKKRNLLMTFAYLSLPEWPRPGSTTAACITQGHMSQSETLFEVRISHLRTSQIPSHFSATWKTVALVPKLSNDFCKSYPQQIGLPQALRRGSRDSITMHFLLQSCTVSGLPGTCLTRASFQAL